MLFPNTRILAHLVEGEDGAVLADVVLAEHAVAALAHAAAHVLLHGQIDRAGIETKIEQTDRGK